ncbi:TetR/AcrR family transcriptional regulator [Tenggerimyces flavus]|uniref:TetR/AcrR family transcriptional regulator n=1 Tax=Tenggerimyces flavus TaxID=1708749 RepID=A0ABV7YD59_9ACTN|nr:TetR/AcrR family transcriptional regulator [Tenggerimyces flavus]MBM7788122.1 AcrR family transcriptional regulator [Tenggerimyces flavus]
MTDAKPLRADARRNRARVLEAARSAFADLGAAVPLDEIARRAGVGAGTIYRHFPTKEALFEAVVAGGLEDLVARSESLLTASDPGAAFFEFFSSMVEQARFNRALCDALEASTGAPMAMVGHSFKDGAQAEFRSTLGVLLTRAQEAGAVRDDVQVPDVVALIAGAVLAAQRHDQDDAIAGRVLTVISDGLRP